jgi:Ca2+-binding EF-hand superfamily protein
MSVKVLAKVFAALDANGNGSISKKELKRGLASLKIYLPQATVDRIFRTIDSSRDGEINYTRSSVPSWA